MYITSRIMTIHIWRAIWRGNAAQCSSRVSEEWPKHGPGQVCAGSGKSCFRFGWAKNLGLVQGHWSTCAGHVICSRAEKRKIEPCRAVSLGARALPARPPRPTATAARTARTRMPSPSPESSVTGTGSEKCRPLGLAHSDLTQRECATQQSCRHGQLAMVPGVRRPSPTAGAAFVLPTRQCVRPPVFTCGLV